VSYNGPIGYFLSEVLYLITDWDIWVTAQEDARFLRRKYEFGKAGNTEGHVDTARRVTYETLPLHSRETNNRGG
jgi:hypothetical protein